MGSEPVVGEIAGEAQKRGAGVEDLAISNDVMTFSGWLW
jgi:hypothetical protein